MPATAPGMASIACARSTSSRLGIEKPLMISATTTEPMSAPRNAPTMPPQKRSGRYTVKCHRAMPIMTHTRTAISRPSPRPTGSRLAQRTRPSARPPVAAVAVAPALGLVVLLEDEVLGHRVGGALVDGGRGLGRDVLVCGRRLGRLGPRL